MNNETTADNNDFTEAINMINHNSDNVKKCSEFLYKLNEAEKLIGEIKESNIYSSYNPDPLSYSYTTSLNCELLNLYISLDKLINPYHNDTGRIESIILYLRLANNIEDARNLTKALLEERNKKEVDG